MSQYRKAPPLIVAGLSQCGEGLSSFEEGCRSSAISFLRSHEPFRSFAKPFCRSHERCCRIAKTFSRSYEALRSIARSVCRTDEPCRSCVSSFCSFRAYLASSRRYSNNLIALIAVLPTRISVLLPKFAKNRIEISTFSPDFVQMLDSFFGQMCPTAICSGG